MRRLIPANAISWVALLACSLLLGGLFRREGVPAAFLIGPLICGIAFSAWGVRLRVARPLFFCAQAMIGGAVAESITGAIVVSVFRDWDVMFLVVGTTVVAAGLVGWALVKCGTLPGTTAAWGSAPGAASAMIAMSEDYGADARLVALMQYLRVLVVVLSASMVSHFVLGNDASALAGLPAASAPAVAWPAVLNAVAVVLVGGWLGHWSRIPAGVLLLPMLLGGVLHSSGWAEMHQPDALKAVSSLLLGWYIGLGFNRAILASAFRLLPRLLLSTVLLIGLCGVSAALLVGILRVDPLTAYLATSPGGLDSIILIAMGSRADIPFVVAVQTLRLFVVILTGPGIARLICRYA